MTARDRFTAKLKCPQCGREGEARLSQEDGWSYAKGDRSTQVDDLPEGFKIVPQRSWYASDLDIFCAKCDVSALDKQL